MLRKLNKILLRRLWLTPLWLVSGKANIGRCPVCNNSTVFVRYDPWLRDNYRCARCWSIPRQRALIKKLEELIPNWKIVTVHESSPGGVSSDHIARKAGRYVASHFFSDIPLGEIKWGFQCENLEEMTFADESFDLVVTQDVMEHVLEPGKAFFEIARTLKPGGMHVFTVPIYSGRETMIRARKGPFGIEHLKPPDYHGNPIDENGSLVVTEWGRDIVEFIKRHSNLETIIYSYSDPAFGLEAEFLDVLVSRKAGNETRFSIGG